MKAYTLIELLVTVTIIILFSGVSISAYLTFNENRQLDNDARMFNSVLNKIRTKAVFLEYPNGCVGLSGITVTSASNSVGKKTILRHKINCSDKIYDGVDEEVLKSTEFSADFNFKFLPLSGNIEDLQDKVVIVKSQSDNTKTITVTVDKFAGSKNEVTK